MRINHGVLVETRGQGTENAPPFLQAPEIPLKLQAEAAGPPALSLPLFFFAAVSVFQSPHLCQGLYFGICGNG